MCQIVKIIITSCNYLLFINPLYSNERKSGSFFHKSPKSFPSNVKNCFRHLKDMKLLKKYFPALKKIVFFTFLLNDVGLKDIGQRNRLTKK